MNGHTSCVIQTDASRNVPIQYTYTIGYSARYKDIVSILGIDVEKKKKSKFLGLSESTSIDIVGAEKLFVFCF